MLPANFYADFALGVIVLLLCAAVFIQLILPRLISAKFTKFQIRVKHWQLSGSLLQSVRICFFCERLIRIDVYDCSLSFSKDTGHTKILHKKHARAGRHHFWLEAMLSLVAFHFHQTKVELILGPSLSANVFLPFISLTGAIKSKLHFDGVLEIHSLLFCIANADQVLLRMKQKLFSVQLDFDNLHQKISGLYVKLNNLQMQTSHQHMHQLAQVSSSFKSRSSSSSSSSFTLPARIELSADNVNFKADDYLAGFSQTNVQIRRQMISSESFIESQIRGRLYYAHYQERHLFSLQSFFCHSGFHVPSSLPSHYFNEIRLICDKLRLELTFGDIRAFKHVLAIRANRGETAQGAIPKIFAWPFQFSADFYDADFQVEQFSLHLNETSSKLHAISDTGNSSLYRLLELSLLNLSVSEIDHCNLMNITSTGFTVEFSSNNGNLRRDVALYIHHATVEAPFACIQKAKHLFRNFLPTAPSQKASQWQSSLRIIGKDVSVCLSLPDERSDLIRIIGIESESFRATRDDEWRSIVCDNSLVAVTTITNSSHVIPSYKLSKENDRVFISKLCVNGKSNVDIHNLDVNWSIPFYTSLLEILGSLRSASKPSPEPSNTFSRLCIRVTSSSFLFNFGKSALIAANADDLSFIRQDNSSVTITTKCGAVAVNGAEFLSWSSMLYLNQSHVPFPDLDLEFVDLTVFLAETVSIGPIVECIRQKWRALKIFQRRPESTTNKIKISTLEFRCICVRIDNFVVVFEENALERSQLYRRWISLNPSGRRRHRRAVLRCRDATLLNDIEDNPRIETLRRTSISRSRSSSNPERATSFSCDSNHGLDPLDDPFMDRFDQLRLLASERIQWALAVFNLEHLLLSLSPVHGDTTPSSAVPRLSELDSTSDTPYEKTGSGKEFSEIWSRQLQVSCTGAMLKLRDYPFALMSFRNLTVKGQIVSACLTSPELFRRRRLMFLPLSHHRKCFATVELPAGSAVPNKFFLDIKIDSVGFEFNYGQCQRAVLAAFSKAAAKLTDSGSLASNSPSLSWWDQLRYKVHGRICFSGNLLSCRVLTSPNPYRDEAILILAESFAFESVKGKMSLSARHFQINLDEGTSSSSYLFRPGLFVASPYIRISLMFTWGCRRSDPSQHYIHHVQWQSVDYEFSSIRTRDLFDDFRAQSVSMKLKIHCLALESGHGPNQLIGPLISFWFENVPWLKQVHALYVNPPNVCTVIPKILLAPNRAVVPAKSGRSFSGLISQIKIQITFASTVFELIAEPQKEKASVANNESALLGIQGFTQLLRFGADLDVISEHIAFNNELTSKKKWVWSKQRARCVHSSLDLLLPILSTALSDNAEEIRDRLSHPLSQTPFATGEGDSGSMFFMSAESVSYCSPSAGGKQAVADLVALADPLLGVQLSPSSKHNPSSMANSLADKAMSAEEISVGLFLHSHFGDFSIRSSDEDSRLQVLSFAAVSDADIDHDFENDLGPSGDDDNREHYISVSGIRVLWNNSIRSSFNAWWSFLSSFGHSQSSTPSTDIAHEPSVTDQQHRGVKHYATWSGTPDQFRRMSRPENIPRRLTSSELFQKLDERSALCSDHEDPVGRESATPSIATDEDGTASVKSNDELAKMSESGHTRFAMRLEKPQVILQSVEVGCSVVISAHQAKVDVIAYPYFFPEDPSPSKSSSFHDRSPNKPVLERKSSSYFNSNGRSGSTADRPTKENLMYFKKTIRSRLDQAQLHVVPNNIDVDSNAMEWIPLEDFPTAKTVEQSSSQEQDFVLDETASSADYLYQTRYLKSNGIFQRISEPTSLGFDYSYDVNMDTKDPGALEYQFLHRSTASESLQHDDELDDQDSSTVQPLTTIDFSLPMLTSSSRLYISKINFVMDSLQCKVLISVIDKLVLSPVQHVWATAKSMQAARRSKTDFVNLDPKDLQKLSAEALGVQQNQPESNVFRRCISYEILGATWTLITKSPDVFLHVQLKKLHGSHRYRIGEGRDVEFGLKEFRIRNLAENAVWPDVVAPHHRWDVAKCSTELMLRVRALVLGWPLQYRERLRDITAWDHFDIKVFPLIIKVQAQHYSCTRDYFFPSRDPLQTRSNSQLLSQSHIVVTSAGSDANAPTYLPYTNRQRRTAMTIRKPILATNRPAETSSILESSSSSTDSIQIISYNYFKYFHISDLEFHIYFRGSFIDLDDLHVIISAFSCNGELWTWDKLLSKIETHVQTSVLKQSKSLIKQKFSSSVKSLAEKEHKIRDRFTAKFGRKPKEDDSSEAGLK